VDSPHYSIWSVRADAHRCSTCLVTQYEISAAALKMLQSTRDAKGRQIEVYKVPLPPNLFITQEEADGLLVSSYKSLRLENGCLACHIY
jgi:agmatine/peptidylarginine deiminase